MREQTENKIKIAIADDHGLFRKGLSEIVAGFDNMSIVFEAGNGAELLEQLKKTAQAPDICILDINMPVMNGYETAAALTKEWPAIKILALSMYDTEFNIIKMLKAGARGYVLKDAEPKELQKALYTIYEDGFYHSELVTGKMHKQVKVEEKITELSFTAKEEQFLMHCCSELTYKDIAELMNVSPRTVDGYRDILFAKLDVKTRTGLVLYAIKSGMVNIA